jgi:hypothetical protein
MEWSIIGDECIKIISCDEMDIYPDSVTQLVQRMRSIITHIIVAGPKTEQSFGNMVFLKCTVIEIIIILKQSPFLMMNCWMFLKHSHAD